MCQTPTRWEYAQLHVRRDASGVQPGPVQYFFGTAPSRGVQLSGGSPLEHLNALGAQGWELLGPPEVTQVVRRQATDGGWQEVLLWTDKQFYLRRRRGPDPEGAHP